ncbi:hypothetical protein EDC01DRAFT_675152 [Geopyxis carbonaria]|nr:hypothetical protein EDC01DRAFT_675152 [Geopyxis carbonaria]
MSPLPPPAVTYTTHTPTGTSVFAAPSPTTLTPLGPSGPAFTLMHATSAVPVSLLSPSTHSPTGIPRCPPAGTLFVTSDMPPGAASPLHRTLSLDYAIVLSGTVTLVLDGGEERVLSPGMCVVQGGTMHKWENRGSETVRMAFVMVGAEEVVLADGTRLEETRMGPPGLKDEE